MKSKLKPLWTATQNLDADYYFYHSEDGDWASVSLAGNDIHTELNMGLNQALKIREDLKTRKQSPVYKSDLSAYNFATMGLTVLYADTPLEEGALGDNVLSHYIPIVSPYEKRVISSLDFYQDTYEEEHVADNKQARCHEFNASLAKRVKQFSAVSHKYHLNGAIASVADLDAMIASSQFHETYHHTEQAGMHYLSTPYCLKTITSELQELDAGVFYGAVLDLHTQRMMCNNCNAGLLGMQNSYSSGFLRDLSKALLKARIDTNPVGAPTLSVRVSAETNCKRATLDAFKLVSKNDNMHDVFPQFDREILQKHTPSTLPNVEQWKFSAFTEALFCSTQIDASKWENALVKAK